MLAGPPSVWSVRNHDAQTRITPPLTHQLSDGEAMVDVHAIWQRQAHMSPRMRYMVDSVGGVRRRRSTGLTLRRMRPAASHDLLVTHEWLCVGMTVWQPKTHALFDANQ